MAALGYRWQDLYPNLNTRTRYPMAETWDLKMYLLATRHLPPEIERNHPVSGSPLSSVFLS